MKNFKLLTLALLSVMVACSDDDNQSPQNSGFAGVNLDINDAKAVDNYNLFSTSHAEYNFVMSDKAITVDASPGSYFGFEVADGAKFAIDVSIAAVGSTFTEGVYTFDENIDFEEPNFSFFDACDVYIDTNNNGILGDGGDFVYQAVGGTITVSGTAPNFQLNFHVEMSNGDTLDFTYNGGFDPIDNRND